MSHAVLSPSAAGQWRYCPGSIVMQAQFPETERSEAAAEGDAAHWVGAETLSGRGADPFIGRKAPNGVLIDEDMVDAATVYVGHVASIIDGPGARGIIVEKPLAIKRVHPECFGTPDARFYDAARKALHIWDLKYGFGIVEPKENKQLICYAIGALDELAETLKTPFAVLDQEITVHLHIAQPRAPHKMGPVRSRSLKGSDLRAWANELNAAAIEALSAEPKCVSGDHCKYCSARLACPAARNAAGNAIDMVDAATLHLLDNAAAVSEYFVLKRAEAAIKNRLGAREGNLIAKIEAGEVVPGLVMECGQGRLAWNKPVAEIIALGDALKKELRAPAAAITPTQAKQRGLSADIVNAYSSTGGAGLKLIPAEKSFAAQAFGGN